MIDTMKIRNALSRFSQIIPGLLFTFLAPVSQPGYAFPAAGNDSDPGETVVLTLEDAVNRALEKNPDALAARQDVKYANARVTEVMAQALTQVNLRTDYTRNIQLPVIFFRVDDQVQQIRIGESNQYNLVLAVTQPIYTFGRVGSALDAARIFKDISKNTEQSALDGVAYQTRLAYYRALLARDNIDVMTLAIELAKENLEQVRSFYRSGTASEFDLLRAEVEYENTGPFLIRARNEYSLAVADLKRLVSLPTDTEVVLADSLRFEPVQVDLDESVEQAVVHRPELRAFRLNVDMMEKALSIEKAERYPVLSFFTNYNVAAQSPKVIPEEEEVVKSWAAGITFDLPIFDGRRRKGRIEQARAEFLKAKYEEEKNERLVRLEVEQSYFDVTSVEQEIRAQAATVKQADRAHELAVIRYENGLSTQLEVRDARLALLRTKTNYLETVYRYNVAVTTLEKAKGMLLDEDQPERQE